MAFPIEYDERHTEYTGCSRLLCKQCLRSKMHYLSDKGPEPFIRQEIKHYGSQLVMTTVYLKLNTFSFKTKAEVWDATCTVMVV